MREISTKLKIQGFILAGFAVITLYMFLWPVSIDPVAYNPPQAPELEEPYTPNDLLQQALLIGKGKLKGPEDLAIDRQGRIYAPFEDGRIMRITLPRGTSLEDYKPAANIEVEMELFARTGGRPLGLAFSPPGNPLYNHLIVADGYRGLLAINPDGEVTVLTQDAEGIPFRFTDHLAIGRYGTIYFTDASHSYGPAEYLYDLLEARPNGRLLKYDPYRKETTVLLDDLYFANGVALSRFGEFLVVNETYRYRIQKYYLSGPRKGETEVFMDNLPGFPDNIRQSGKGTFWLCLFTVRNPMMDAIHPSPLLKSMLARLPRFLWPKPKPYGFVAEIDEEGNVIRTLQEPTGEHLKEITGAVEYQNYLYMGSLHNDRIGVIKVR